jgi:hypothetical protein
MLKASSGVMLVTFGGGSVTVNPFGSVPVWVSGFVTTTFQGPVAAPVIERVQVICVGEATFTSVAAISA